MQANQLHLVDPLRGSTASMAYVLLSPLRRIGLPYTQFARASCGTIRLALLKVGALVRRSVCRLVIAMASACPVRHEFALAHALLRRPMA
jgi:Transposase DDE domain group 1